VGGVTLLQYELAILYELINRTGAREVLCVVANALVSKHTPTTPEEAPNTVQVFLGVFTKIRTLFQIHVLHG
jgi:hypothetical protein